MIELNVFLTVLIADLAVELPLIALLVLKINPKMAAVKTKDVLLSDDKFREDLVAMLTTDLFKPIEWSENGAAVQKMPIEIVSGYLIAGMKSWISGKQSEMTQELNKNVEESMQTMPDNPLMGLALQQIPKKYRPYVQIAANLFLQQQNR